MGAGGWYVLQVGLKSSPWSKLFKEMIAMPFTNLEQPDSFARVSQKAIYSISSNEIGQRRLFCDS